MEKQKPRFRVMQTDNKLTLIRIEGCERVLVGYFHQLNKYFLYLGFNTQQEALNLRAYLLEKGLVRPYNHKKDEGMNLPRPAKYVKQAWEIKIHRPTMEIIEMFARKERANNTKAAA